MHCGDCFVAKTAPHNDRCRFSRRRASAPSATRKDRSVPTLQQLCLGEQVHCVSSRPVVSWQPRSPRSKASFLQLSPHDGGTSVTNAQSSLFGESFDGRSIVDRAPLYRIPLAFGSLIGLCAKRSGKNGVAAVEILCAPAEWGSE